MSAIMRKHEQHSKDTVSHVTRWGHFQLWGLPRQILGTEAVDQHMNLYPAQYLALQRISNPLFSDKAD